MNQHTSSQAQQAALALDSKTQRLPQPQRLSRTAAIESPRRLPLSSFQQHSDEPPPSMRPFQNTFCRLVCDHTPARKDARQRLRRYRRHRARQDPRRPIACNRLPPCKPLLLVIQRQNRKQRHWVCPHGLHRRSPGTHRRPLPIARPSSPSPASARRPAPPPPPLACCAGGGFALPPPGGFAPPPAGGRLPPPPPGTGLTGGGAPPPPGATFAGRSPRCARAVSNTNSSRYGNTVTCCAMCAFAFFPGHPPTHKKPSRATE